MGGGDGRPLARAGQALVAACLFGTAASWAWRPGLLGALSPPYGGVLLLASAGVLLLAGSRYATLGLLALVCYMAAYCFAGLVFGADVARDVSLPYMRKAVWLVAIGALGAAGAWLSAPRGRTR